MKKRIISLLLVAVMLASMIPTALIPVFAEPSSDRVIKKVDSATLDGKNTNGEYDSANEVLLNAYGNDKDGDKMRIIYTDEAIYVLVEVFDNTLVRYGTYLNDGTTKAGSSKSDFVFLGFSMGTSFQGMKRVYRATDGSGRSVFQVPGSSVNMSNGGSGTLETKYFGYTEDENGFRLEARFPVSEMSAADQALYKAGQLEIRFTAGTQDGENKGTEFAISYDGDIENRGWDGSATEDFFQSGSYKAKNPSNYTEYAFEIKENYITYASKAPVMDGRNTAGEYANATKVALSQTSSRWWGRTPDADDVAYVTYAQDGIYAFIETTVTPGNGGVAYDQVGIAYKVGSSYAGTKLAQATGNNDGLVTNLDSAAYKIGGTNEGYYFSEEFFGYYYDSTKGTLALEVRLPVEYMTAADQAAFKDGTLDIALGFLNMDEYATVASFQIESYNAFTSKSNAEKYVFPYLVDFKLADKGCERIPYVSNAPTLDGKLDDGEYDDALVVPFEHSGAGWWGKAPDDNDVAYIVYAKDAIYVYVNGDASGSTSWDMTGIGFEIGTSYKGSVAGQGVTGEGKSNINYLYSLGEKTVDKSFFISSADGKMSLEARFPVANMTAADQAAYKDGTLSIKFNFMNMDNYAATASFPIKSYSAFTSQANSEKHVLPNLTEFMLDERVETIPHTPFAPTLDGVNTKGEYDDAFVIPFEYIGLSWWTEKPLDDNDVAYVVYAQDAIYVYVNGDASGATSWDMTGIGFEIGTSYKGSVTGQGVNEEGKSNINYLYSLGEKTVEKSFFASSPDGKMSLEARFPVDKMTAADQEAFANGTLEIGLNFMNMDNYSPCASFQLGAYSAFTSQEKAEKYVLPYLTKFKLGEMTEIENFIPHTTTAPYFDGLNTNGEYDNAFVLPLSYTGTGWWGRPSTDDDVAYVMYTDNAIYVYIKGNKGTTNETYDMTGVAFKIGSSYVGSKIVQNDYFGSTLVSLGEVKMTNDGSYFAYQYDQAAGVLALEAKFPVANMTEADKEAFKNGKLSIALGAISMDNYVTVSSFPIGSYNAFTSQTNVEKYVLPNLALFALGQRTTEGQINYLPYANDGIKMDGKITDGEYDNAFVLPLSHSGLSWWGRTPTDNDVAYVTYTQDAIYVFIKGNKGTTNESYDMTGIGFKIGSSYVGTKIVQNNYFNSTLISLGEVEVTNDNNFFRYYYSKDQGILDLEVKFPIDKMTEEDQIAFKNGTLSVELGAMNMDNYTTVASFPIGSYSAFLSKANAEKYVLPYLTSLTLKPYVFDATEDPETVEIKGKINLKHNVFCFLPSYDGVMMKYTIGDNAPVYVKGVLVDEFAKEYSFSYEVSYKYMNEKVTVELVDREYAVLELVDTYTIVEYCQGLLEQTAEELGISANEYEFMKMMVEATLAMGEATENAVGHAPAFGAAADPIVESNEETFGVEILESGVYFDGEQINKMYVKFKADDISKLTVGFATETLRYIATLEILPVDGEDDTYIVITPVIDATNFDDNYIISFVHAEDVYTRNTVHKITCNVNAGLVALAESTDAVIADLAEATYNYGVAVRYYKAS